MTVLQEHFIRALLAAEIRYEAKREERGNSWEEMNLADLYAKYKKHSIRLGALIADPSASHEDIADEAVDVLVYSMMITEQNWRLGLIAEKKMRDPQQ